MTARVVDLAQRSRNRSPNGRVHQPPTVPTLSVDIAAFASQRCRANDIPATADGRLYLLINPDNTFTVKIARAGESHSLVLQGSNATSAPVILREILSWLYGISPAVLLFLGHLFCLSCVVSA
jgi:hypothetical protein